MDTSIENNLAALKILVTRPQHQADNFCHLLATAGARPERFATLEIHGPADKHRVNALLDQLDSYDLAIFISPNAVIAALTLLRARGENFPQALARAAIGPATAAALRESGLPASLIAASGADSESLLAEPTLQDMHGLRVIIFRGRGGRALLGDMLRERGATTDYAEVYQRVSPQNKTLQLGPGSGHEDLDLITVTSAEGLQNLYDMTDAALRPLLLDIPLAVGGQRIAAAARQLGFNKIAVVAEKPTDEAMLTAILAWAKRVEKTPHE